jgi:parallel beta-helix repeat protein
MRNRSRALVRPAVVALAAGAALGVLHAQPSSAAATGTWINTGGGAVTDAAGQSWSADQGYTGGWGYTTTSPIKGTTSPALFQSERAGVTGYAVPVSAAGTYRVTMDFAELYWNGPGQRVFSVTAEGKPVVSGLDIYATVGKYAALTKTVDVAVSDGTLNLGFSATADLPTIAALSVTPVSSTSPTPAPTSAPTSVPTATPAPACTTTMAAGGNINTFINGLSAGAVGCIPGGTYTGANVEMSKSGTSSAPITVQSVPGQTAKLKMRLSVTSGYDVFRGLDFDTDHQLGTSNTWVKSTAHDVTFVANEFADSGLTGTTLHDGQCLYSDWGSSNIKILRNYFHDCGSLDQFHHGMYVNGTGYTIADNLVVRTKAWGIHLYPELDNSLVANNTVDGSGRAGIIVASDSHGNRIENNVVSNNAQGGIDGYADTGSNVVANNLCWNNGSFCVESGDGFTGSGNVSGDPLYVNRAGGDFHTAATSPAVNTGDLTNTVGPDKDGVARPQGSGPDKGAYER